MQRRMVIVLPFAPFLALAAPQGKGRAKGQQKGSAADSGAVELRFRSQDVRVILDYYRPGGGLPPGLAKRGDLPPGLEKQLRRKGTLPPVVLKFDASSLPVCLITLKGEGLNEAKLRDQYRDKKNKAINYDLYVQQLAEVDQSFGALVKQLPNKSEIDALLTDINQAGLGRGLQFDLFKPAPQEKMADFYAELPINIKITGNYHDIGAFASDVAALPRIADILHLDEPVVIPGGGGGVTFFHVFPASRDTCTGPSFAPTHSTPFSSRDSTIE